MANTAWRSVRARCPFYCKSYDQTISCSVNERDRIRYSFGELKHCNEHFRKHCATNYMRCPIFCLIEKIIMGS